jgi:hypothetical protein
MKTDVDRLRQEIADLRQQIQHSPSQQRRDTSTKKPFTIFGKSQLPSRSTVTQNRRTTDVDNTNSLNMSTTYRPSALLMPRPFAIIDPRQARKIEQ